MPLFREENFLVIHAGSENTLFLFGLSDSLTPPQHKVPTVVYLDPATNEYRFTNPAGSFEPVRPIVGGRIVNVGAFQALLKFVLQTIIQNHPILTINQVPLLLIAPSVSYSRTAVEEITKFVFETLEFTAFNVLDLSVAATFGLGITSSSVVVNIGHDSTQIVPVIGGTAIKAGAKRLPVGGATIDAELQKLLPNLSPAQIQALKHSAIYEVLNDHQDTYYSMADLSEEKAAEIDIAKIVTENNGAVELEKQESEDEEKLNSELQTNTFTDATGQKISIGKERFQGTGKLVSAIAEGIATSLEHVPDLDKRQECYDNIIFVGGTSNVRGLKQAVVLKLVSEYLVKPPSTKKGKTDANGVNSAIAAYQSTDDAAESSGDHAGASPVPSSIKLAKVPDYFPEWKVPKDVGGAWSDVFFLGGQIYAKQVFGANSNHGGDSFIDTDIYEERGPSAIWDMCL